MTNMVNMTNNDELENMVNESRTCRFVVMMTKAELARIQEFRFANRIASMSEAARLLIRDAFTNAETKAAAE